MTRENTPPHPTPPLEIRRLTSCIPEYLDQADERQTPAPLFDDDAAGTLHAINVNSGWLITYHSDNQPLSINRREHLRDYIFSHKDPQFSQTRNRMKKENEGEGVTG